MDRDLGRCLLGLLEPLAQIGGHCPKCFDCHCDHCCLHPQHLLRLLTEPLVLLRLLVFLLSDVAVTQYRYIYHYGRLSLPVHRHYVRLVSHHQFVSLYLEVPKDLSSVILNTLGSRKPLAHGSLGPELWHSWLPVEQSLIAQIMFVPFTCLLRTCDAL